MIHFVLCDDSLQFLNRLEKSFEGIFVKNDIPAKISFKSSNAYDVLNYVSSNSVDVLVLDINLKSTISGFDIADSVRKKNKDAYIIFLTGHLEYALVAYRYKTFDYISKPVCDERLEETVLRLIEDRKKTVSKFIKINNSTVIKLDDINYIKKDGMKLIFCTASKEYEIYSSFLKIQDCLPDNFVRCHKSYIVNINKVANLTTSENLILFEHNTTCYIGAKYKSKFLKVLNYGNYAHVLECVNK